MKKREFYFKKIDELDGFDPREFNVSAFPCSSTDICNMDIDCMEDLKAEAAKIDGICIVIINDSLGEYTLGQSCCKGRAYRMVLFNAVECHRTDAEAQAIIHNTGRGL